MNKKALVLSGGSIKGAFQAGAIETILNEGFRPDAIYGISVGSLNGAFLADRAGRQQAQNGSVDWPSIGRELTEFWVTRVTDPEAIAERHGALTLAWQLIRKTFNGLSKTDGLQRLVREVLDTDHIRTSPVRLGVGSVNVVDGSLIQATNENPNLIDYVIASTAIPVVMPFAEIENRVLVDGGVRDVAPLRFATDFQAKEIWCVVCQPKDLESVAMNFRDPFPYAGRLMEIVTNELVNNDLAYASFVNRHAPEDGTFATEGPFAGKRKLDIKVVRPRRKIPVELDAFTPQDIRSMIERGREAARRPVVL